MILDPITLLNKKEYFAFSGSLDGKFYHQHGNKVDVGTYHGCGHDISDACFFTENVLEFPNEKQAQEYVYNLVSPSQFFPHLDN